MTLPPFILQCLVHVVYVSCPFLLKFLFIIISKTISIFQLTFFRTNNQHDLKFILFLRHLNIFVIKWALLNGIIMGKIITENLRQMLT
jgi:hypothetical protein